MDEQSGTMALWIAYRPDGAGRARVHDSEGRTSRTRAMLAPEPWLVNRLARVSGCDDIARLALAACRSESASAKDLGESEQSVCCLVRVTSEGAEHWQGWRSQWSHECKLQLAYHREPIDAYSLRVSDVVACSRPVPITFGYAPEQKRIASRSGRSGDDASIHSARLVKLHNQKFLSIVDWGGAAADVELGCPGAWKWSAASFDCHQGQGTDELILSDSDGVEDDDDAGLLLGDVPAADILKKWGIATLADDIPVLLVPEPIAFLVCRNEWQDLLLRACWHDSLVLRTGQRWRSDMPLLSSIAWPPSWSLALLQAHMHAETRDAADIPDLDAQDLNECRNIDLKNTIPPVCFMHPHEPPEVQRKSHA